MQFKYYITVGMESHDVETMKKVYDTLRHGVCWVYREIDGYVDPFTGAYICNLPLAQISMRGGSNYRIVCWFGKKMLRFGLRMMFKAYRAKSNKKES